MALSLAEQLQRVGMPGEQAKLLADAIANAGGGPVAWGNITGAQAGVEVAVAAKAQIAALTSGSDAADVVAALQA
ncbi:MAG: hypothetical protein M9945_12695 [Aquamicrobium sp.]|uniref:hypothetical protein n=1 Tax=Aquamicrobium sp. TaxID=1872579 RepID=UPI00349E9B8F|nr:hypothetical protein [Aquamicrobium sp.]